MKQKVESFSADQPAAKRQPVNFSSPATNPFRTLPKDAPARQGGPVTRGNYNNNNGSQSNYHNISSNNYRGRGGMNNRGGGMNTTNGMGYRGGFQGNVGANMGVGAGGYNNTPQMGMGGGYNNGQMGGGMGRGNFNSFNNNRGTMGMGMGMGMRGGGGMGQVGGMGIMGGGMAQQGGMGMMGAGMPMQMGGFNPMSMGMAMGAMAGKIDLIPCFASTHDTQVVLVGIHKDILIRRSSSRDSRWVVLLVVVVVTSGILMVLRELDPSEGWKWMDLALGTKHWKPEGDLQQEDFWSSARMRFDVCTAATA